MSENGDLYEAAGAADATACSGISGDGGIERLISWVTEKGGALREPPDIVLPTLQAVREPQELIAGVMTGRLAMG
jgi:hypothetical protein